MISLSHIKYVFFVNKEIGTECKAPCTFNSLIQIIYANCFKAQFFESLSQVVEFFIPYIYTYSLT